MQSGNTTCWYGEAHFRSPMVPPTDQQIKSWLPELSRKVFKEWGFDAGEQWHALGNTLEGKCVIAVVACQHCAVPNCFVMSCTVTNEGRPIVDEKRIGDQKWFTDCLVALPGVAPHQFLHDIVAPFPLHAVAETVCILVPRSLWCAAIAVDPGGLSVQQLRVSRPIRVPRKVCRVPAKSSTMRRTCYLWSCYIGYRSDE